MTLQVQVLRGPILPAGSPRPFTLNVSRLDGPDVLESVTIAGGFTLDRDHLDDRSIILGGPTVPRSWQDIASGATSVTIKRGNRRDGIHTRPDIGTATITANSHLKDLGITVGTPLRVLWEGATLFTGKVSAPVARWRKEYNRDNRSWAYDYTLTATDLVADLPSYETKIHNETYGQGWPVPVGPDPDGEYPSRFAQIIEPHPDLYWRKTTTVGPQHNHIYDQLTEPRTVLEHLDLATASINALWWIDPDGLIAITEIDPTRPADLTLSALDPARSFTAIDAAQRGPDDIVTGLTITWITVETDLDNNGNPTERERKWTATWDDPTLTATYGPHRATIEVSGGIPEIYFGGNTERLNLNAPEDYLKAMAPWLNWALTPWTPDPLTIDTVTVNGIPPADIGTAIDITDLAPTAPTDRYRADVIAIEHHITPRATHTTLTLRGRNNA